MAEKEGFAKFVSVQNHYNLLFREEEREMAKLCAEDNIAMTPYSALASGRLSRRPGETSKRLQEDSYAKLKYDGTAETDKKIKRVQAGGSRQAQNRARAASQAAVQSSERRTERTVHTSNGTSRTMR